MSNIREIRKLFSLAQRYGGKTSVNAECQPKELLVMNMKEAEERICALLAKEPKDE